METQHHHHHHQHEQHHVEKLVTLNDSRTTTIVSFKNQNYEQLKADCLKNKRLFEDKEFPASDRSIAYSRPAETHYWKRPSEIIRSPNVPVFMQDGASPDDLDQGYLGDCWFISACAGVCMKSSVFPKVVPPNQDLSGPNYAGIFHFRFWIYGQWYDVVVDDKLPVRPDGRLLFCSNVEQPREFWAALLEKAYAKVCLCYENLDGGFSTDAFVDMSGGISESFMVKEYRNSSQRNVLWDMVVKSFKYDTLVGCAINADPNIREARLPSGLVMGHAYTLERAEVVKYGGQYVKLVRVRNPWGNAVEWKGPWCDGSREWSMVPVEVQNYLGYKRLPDGTWWMTFDDFCNNYDTLDFCSVVPDGYPSEMINGDRKPNLTWKSTFYDGRWVPNQSSGGNGSDPRAYWTNPQFLITLNDVDTDDHENKATVIISLMQKYTSERRMQKNGEYAEEPIQFRLYKVVNPADANKVKQTGMRLYANQLIEVGVSGQYINLKDVTKRFRVPVGDYVVIPSCYYQNIDLQFLLRVFTEEEIKQSNCKILNKHKEKLEDVDITHVKTPTGAFEDVHSHLVHSSCGSSDVLNKDGRKDCVRKHKHDYVKLSCSKTCSH